MGTLVVQEQGVPTAAKRQRAYGVSVREKYAGAMRLVEELWPERWEKVRWCRYHPVALLDENDKARFGVRPKSCAQVPYCVMCTEVADKRTGGDWVDRFWKCTPPGKMIRAFHVVMTRPMDRKGEKRLWGWRALEDVSRFRIWGIKMLEHLFGPGIGGVINFQAFGNSPFSKPFPHLDCMVNGYALKGGNPVRLQAPSFEGSIKGAYYAASMKLADAIFMGADVGSNIEVSPVFDEYYPLVAAMKYSTREMIQFSAIDYRPARGRVEWVDYKTQARDRTDVGGFLAFWNDYNRRYAPRRLLPASATEAERKACRSVNLTRGFGYMAPRTSKFSEALIGGNPPKHRSGCVCTRCVEWVKVRLDRDDALERNADGSPVRVV